MNNKIFQKQYIIILMLLLTVGVGKASAQSQYYYVFYNATKGFLYNNGGTLTAGSAFNGTNYIWYTDNEFKDKELESGTTQQIQSYSDNKYLYVAASTGNDDVSLNDNQSKVAWYSRYTYLTTSPNKSNYYWLKWVSDTKFQTLNNRNSGDYLYSVCPLTINEIPAALTAPTISGIPTSLTKVNETADLSAVAEYTPKYIKYTYTYTEKAYNANVITGTDHVYDCYSTDGGATATTTPPTASSADITYEWSLSSELTPYATIDQTGKVTVTSLPAGSEVVGNVICKASKTVDGVTTESTETKASLIINKCATPTITLTPSDNGKTATATINCSTAGAIVYYTTDGTEPNESTTTHSATLPITITGITNGTTIKALAVNTIGGVKYSSNVASNTFFNQKVSTPEIEIVGNYVSFKCDDQGVTFYYTTDGSTPTTSSKQWDGNTITNIKDGATIQVIAVKDGFAQSEVASKVKSKASVVYIDGNDGNDDNDGYSYANRVKTITRAFEQLQGSTVDGNIIVVCGTLNPSGRFRCTGQKPCTFTGKYGGTDYSGVIRIITGNSDDSPATTTLDGTGHNFVLADTRFQYLTFKGDGGGNNILCLNSKDVTFGKGLKNTGFGTLEFNHGNLNNEAMPELTILLTESNPTRATEESWEMTKPQVVTFQSGHYGRILGGRYTSGFFRKEANTSYSILATKTNPVWTIINVEIDKDNPNDNGYVYDINSICNGLTDGTMYGDMIINVNGGSLSYVVGSNQGNAVNNGNFPNSSFYGRAVINVEQKDALKDVTLNNIFPGGLGRNLSGSNVCDLLMYGQTEVNIKSGTIKHSVYGGGSGGVMGMVPWDRHIPYNTSDADNSTDTFHGVKYGKIGSGTELASVSLHTLNEDHTGFADGRESLSLANSSSTINISGGEIKENVYGGGYGTVQGDDGSTLLPAKIAPRGAGSLFGTANINITGGNIGGSVYGGGRGATAYIGQTNNNNDVHDVIAELNGTVNMNITGTDDQYPTIGGNIFGGGAGITSGWTDTYARIASAGHTGILYNSTTYDYTTTINVTIDLPASHPFGGTVYGGGESGMVDGNPTVNIKNGQIGTTADPKSVYGGGKGTSAVLKGNTVVNQSGGTVTENVFGGGDAAKVDGNTSVKITGPSRVGNNVYGGGNAAEVTGTTNVQIGDKCE